MLLRDFHGNVIKKFMKRNNLTTDSLLVGTHALHSKNVVHEAGHATAIHLYNKQKKLPRVFFQIKITGLREAEGDFAQSIPDHPNNYLAKVEGGRLIDSLSEAINAPMYNLEICHEIGLSKKNNLQAAIEADIVNLLIGPLAEAKFVALCDDELFDLQLLTLESLQYYGAESDLKLVNQYLQNYIPHLALRERKITELFACAFAFVDDDENWNAITTLAQYILYNNKEQIDYEEVISIIDCELIE